MEEMINQTMLTKVKGYNQITRINNFNLSYDDVGDGNVPIIFLHGFPFDKTMWHLQLDSLQTLYRLITVDLRGFGKSNDEETALSIDLFADDLIKFMDNLSIDKAVICGLSMGGYIALNAANRFPDRFEALILCDTQCNADTEEIKQKRYEAIEDIKINGAAGFNEGFIKKVFSKDAIKNKKKLVAQLKTVAFSNSFQTICRGLVAIAERRDSCSGLSKIAIPTLIICGSEDEVTPLLQSEYLQANIKGSILKVINHAGHVSNLEQPGEFNKTLADFLRTLQGVGVELFSWN
jgi:pimeloyl-ACP methyl ester carboxylesterase